ncbi:hypothetical protein MBLNU459_g2435t1 [Dothideomycetes sp. NU459]
MPELLIDFGSTDTDPINSSCRPILPSKARPPIPSKPKSLASNSGQALSRNPPVLLRAQSVNVPRIERHHEEGGHRIRLIDFEDENDSGHGTHDLHHFRDEAYSESDYGAPAMDHLQKGNDGNNAAATVSNPFDRARQQTLAFSSNLIRDVQSMKIAPPTSPKPKELGQKFVATFNPLFSDAKSTIGKAAQPIGDATQKGFENVRNETIAGLKKAGITDVFMKTGDDLADAAAKLRGNKGLCSKCKTLPVHACFPSSSNGPDVTVSELEWAIPLSRIIYHADWCRFCRLLLGLLCLAPYDPLQHPAVRPHMQPEIEGYSMERWTSQGWEECDKHWPFGHGEKRHEGASYIMGPVGEELKDRLLGFALGTITMMKIVNHHKTPGSARRSMGYQLNHRRDMERMSRRNRYYNHRKQLDTAKNPNKHPLSCVLTVSIKTHISEQNPGMLFVNLLGYGRGLGADVQELSSFRLRAIRPASSDDLPPVLPPRGLSNSFTYALDTANPRSTSEALVGKPARAPFTYGRLLDKKWIDPSIGKDWLSECERHHGTQCSQHGWDVAMRKPVSLRAINVHDLCLAEISNPAECRFVSLSYVWGGARTLRLRSSNIDNLMRKNGLLRYIRELPQTILDAIEVVKAIGEQWLWVDSICILQEDTQEAREQIASMDRIYGSALVNIVAADGRDAHAGLSGIKSKHTPQAIGSVDRQRSFNQLSADFTDGVSLVAPLRSDIVIDATPWNSRAWTFQERLLSRRLIVFSQGQMTWHCRSMICREDMPVADSGCPHTPLEWLGLKPRYLGVDTAKTWVDGNIEISRHETTHIVRSGTFAEYAKVIEEYTHRRMSFETDVIDALAGLSHIFTLCFKSKLIYGLPSNLLDVALLWRPTQQLYLREGPDGQFAFPSWSWAGWVGRVSYVKPFRVSRHADGSFESYEQDKSGEEGIRPLIRWHAWAGASRRPEPINGTGRGFPFENPTLPAEWENSPFYINENGHGAPQSVPDVPARAACDERTLVFWTSSTSALDIGADIVQQSDRAWNTDSPPLRFRLCLAGLGDVGTILLDGAYIDMHRWEQQEYILIAEAQYLDLDDEVKDVEDCPYYVVMLIEWDDRRRFARRMGLGRVMKSAWMLASPKLKLVSLQ